MALSEITLDEWADVMDGSANAATRARVREAMNAPGSQLNAFLTHLENDTESLLARSLNAVKSTNPADSGEQTFVQPDYVIVRSPTFFESSKHALSFPARFLLRAAASSMADYWYFSSAAQIQQLLCSLETFGAQQIQHRLELASLLTLAKKPKEAIAELLSLIDPQTHRLPETLLVGMDATEVELQQTLVSEAIAQYFVGRRLLDNAKTAIEVVTQHRKRAELPQELLPNHLNMLAMFDTYSQNLDSAAERLIEMRELCETSASPNRQSIAVAARNLASVQERRGIDAAPLFEEAKTLFTEAYPGVDYSESLEQLPFYALERKGVALVCC